MIYVQEQYLEFTSDLTEDAALYGLGESTESKGLRLQRDGAPIVLWNRDCALLPRRKLMGCK